MGLAPGYEKDIFISYAHVDNATLADDQDGWVSLLHDRLSKRLCQLLGESVDIWRDPKLSGNDIFGQAILLKLQNAALLVSVLSPRYLRSEWCMKELNEFYSEALLGDGISIDGKLRIYNVIKTPVRPEELPDILQSALGYSFFALDSKSGRFREFGFDPGARHDQRYWDMLEDLAQDIKELIEGIRSQQGVRRAQASRGLVKTIYLAETTSDMNDQRLRLRRELKLHGHRVLPDRPLPHTERFQKVVSDLLTECQFAVHLIGDTYGIIPEGESESILQLQRRLTEGMPRVVWMPAGLTSADERQQRYINHLLDQGCDLFQDKLEDLKDYIHAKLSPRKPPPESKLPAGRNGNRNAEWIYLVYDQQDYSTAAPVEDYLFDIGYEIISMADDTDLQTHRENLLLCDAVLTYCGRTSDAWLNKKKSDLIKLPGYGRTKPMLARGFYISAPQSDVRDRFRIHDGVVIRNYGDFTPASLDPFLEQIKYAKGVN